MKDNTNAFPLPMGTDIISGTEGMTMRDYFAGQALILLTARRYKMKPISKVCEAAYIIADQMMAERNR